MVTKTMNRKEQKQLAKTGKPVFKLHVLGAAGGVTGSLNLIEVYQRERVTRFLLDVGLHVDDEHADRTNRLPRGLTAKDIDFIIVSHAHIDHSGYLPKIVKDGFNGTVYCTAATRDLMHILLPDSGHLQEERAKQLNKRLLKRAGEASGANTSSGNGATSGDAGTANPRHRSKFATRRGTKGSRKHGGFSRGSGDGVAHSAQKAPGAQHGHGDMQEQAAARGISLKQPLYTELEARASLKNVREIPLRQRTKLADNVHVTLTEAGHILGSAVVNLELGEGSDKRTLCFTGNVGRPGSPLLQDLEPITGADYIITEATYGNRRHVNRDRLEHLAGLINAAYERAKVSDKKFGFGQIIIPAFAVGRAQILLDDIRQLIESKRIPLMPVYLDGRMSNTATDITRRHRSLLNRATQAVFEAGGDPFTTPRQTNCVEWRDSAMLLDPQPEPILIVGSSGMANGGRIVSHLEKRLPGRQNTIIFVGYQGTGTLGNSLVRFAGERPESVAAAAAGGARGPKTVNVAGKPVPIRATVEFMGDYSGHADYADIIAWMKRMKRKPKAVYVVHGDTEALDAMREHVATSLRWNAVVPKAREVFDLE